MRPAGDVPGGASALAEFHTLGPFGGGGRRPAGQPGSTQQRALLALLVSRLGQPVAVETILGTLWPDGPPPSAMTSLQAYVANLRPVLEPERAPGQLAAVLRTCPNGYLLDGHLVEVDVRWFGERAAAGWRAWDRGDPHQALGDFGGAGPVARDGLRRR